MSVSSLETIRVLCKRLCNKKFLLSKFNFHHNSYRYCNQLSVYTLMISADCDAIKSWKVKSCIGVFRTLPEYLRWRFSQIYQWLSAANYFHLFFAKRSILDAWQALILSNNPIHHVQVTKEIADKQLPIAK